MLQIDHVYEFLYQSIFTDFDLYHTNGVIQDKELTFNDIVVFTRGLDTVKKILCYDQEPLLDKITDRYLDIFQFPNNYTLDDIIAMTKTNTLPYGIPGDDVETMKFHSENLDALYKQMTVISSEKSELINNYAKKYNSSILYYFFHGFAALDWYRGYYALNYNKLTVKSYKYDFISFNRIINNDRSYRIYFVSLLKEQGLLPHGQVSFNVTDNLFDDWQDETADPNTKLSADACQHIEHHLTGVSKLVIDFPKLPGSASADILRDVDAFWHVVTETVFYYDKLHLTEKIFKPIVMKQPFMLLAAPGNLAYLKSYGFKTFEGIIDESYDTIVDNDQRIEAVVEQVAWYCALSAEEKQQVIEAIAPIVEYNFHHFYGEFKHIITRELLDNCRTLFKEIGHNDSNIAYEDIYKTLIN
jgi:hypothetical protein